MTSHPIGYNLLMRSKSQVLPAPPHEGVGNIALGCKPEWAFLSPFLRGHFPHSSFARDFSRLSRISECVSRWLCHTEKLMKKRSRINFLSIQRRPWLQNGDKETLLLSYLGQPVLKHRVAQELWCSWPVGSRSMRISLLLQGIRGIEHLGGNLFIYIWHAVIKQRTRYYRTL